MPENVQPYTATDKTPDLLAVERRDWFLDMVREERASQRRQWGDEHDDNKNGWEWGGVIALQAGRFVSRVREEERGRFVSDLMAHALVCTAATCCAAYEWLQRRDARRG